LAEERSVPQAPSTAPTRSQVIALGVLLASASCACLTRFFIGPLLALWVAVPAIFMLGVAVYGHLITFDDDFPGGWSNLDGSWKYFRHSLYELLGKAAFLAGLLAILLL
jgi:hypothetical protein